MHFYAHVPLPPPPPPLREAARQGSGDVMAMLDFNFGKDKHEYLTSMDLNEDAVIIIDAVGLILLVSQVGVCVRVSICVRV